MPPPTERDRERCGAEHDPVCAGGDQGAGILERADAPGGLEGRGGDRRGDCPNELGARVSGTGAVEVDEVDPTCACLGEAGCESDGVACLVDDLLVVATMEADGALAEDVHGGDHFDRRGEPVAHLKLR